MASSRPSSRRACASVAGSGGIRCRNRPERRILAAICIPAFPELQLSWLQKLRAAHDPYHFRLIAPHVTLVFPTTAVPEALFVAHVAACTRGADGATVEFDSVREVRDADTELHLVYLMPRAGTALFTSLHEKLYAGPLAAAARRDIPFLPHITLGRFASSSEAATLAARLRSDFTPIAGRVDAIDVVHIADDRIRTVHRERLADNSIA